MSDEKPPPGVFDVMRAHGVDPATYHPPVITTNNTAAPERNFEGHEGRECGEHRTLGQRAWCHDCSEKCSANLPCMGCELPQLRAALDRLREQRDAVLALHRRVSDNENWCRVCCIADTSLPDIWPCATARALGVTDAD